MEPRLPSFVFDVAFYCTQSVCPALLKGYIRAFYFKLDKIYVLVAERHNNFKQ